MVLPSTATTKLAFVALRSPGKWNAASRHRITLYRMASTSSFGLKDASLLRTQGFIDGKWVDAKEGGKISVTNPATAEELGTIPEMGLSETKEAIDAASKAFKTWSKTTAKERHDLLMKFYALMKEHDDDLSRLITLENGKPYTEAKGENAYSASFLELANRAGIPPGVINVVTTHGNIADVGRELCENPIVKKVSFTGSTPVAKMLYKYAAGTMKKMSIEAGGNAPFIVFDDADIGAAVEGALACKFRGSGQTCVCANRIYVHSSIYAEFASRLAEKVAAFKVGDGFEKSTTHGPLIHERAVEKVQKHVDDAVSRGAQLVHGGKRLDGAGSFFAPTILADVPADALVCQEETFGPLAALTKFETEEEVIKLANDTPVGLAGYFYSRDVGRVWRVAEALEVGMVGTNTGAISQAVIPFGGVKESGLGREGSHGIEEYMNTKYIAFGGL
ncbi:hypothetical protein PHLCEN_2v6564 [Hermanssonia centrifuga]|uniref:Aldehyde dehydrogenase domain-containing protein n=1 Tax=Hermanssonia centrifuga TaxID=98765 RepID=A0A2R6NZ59_9APHY|nr:hypothetical protein PHLCEN_2v6564 [Hermanssonia centrifuga]